MFLSIVVVFSRSWLWPVDVKNCSLAEVDQQGAELQMDLRSNSFYSIAGVRVYAEMQPTRQGAIPGSALYTVAGPLPLWQWVHRKSVRLEVGSNPALYSALQLVGPISTCYADAVDYANGNRWIHGAPS